MGEAEEVDAAAGGEGEVGAPGEPGAGERGSSMPSRLRYHFTLTVRPRRGPS
jgi:hypothetical protein